MLALALVAQVAGPAPRSIGSTFSLYWNSRHLRYSRCHVLQEVKRRTGLSTPASQPP